MVSSDFRREAREKLSGKWGKAVLVTLVYFIITVILSGFEEKTQGVVKSFFSILSAVVLIPLGYGLTISFLKLFKGEKVEVFDFITEGFNNFGRSWGLVWNTFIKLLGPIALVIVSIIVLEIRFVGAFLQSSVNAFSVSSMGALGFLGFILLLFAEIWLIMKSYYYSLSQFIAIEKTDLTTKDAVAESKNLMTGKRGKLFCLQFSFIGWAILAAFSLGIGTLWLFPYMQIAAISFYKFASGNKEMVVEDTPNAEE